MAIATELAGILSGAVEWTDAGAPRADEIALRVAADWFEENGQDEESATIRDACEGRPSLDTILRKLREKGRPPLVEVARFLLAVALVEVGGRVTDPETRKVILAAEDTLRSAGL